MAALKPLLVEWSEFLKGDVLIAARRVDSRDRTGWERRQPPAS